MYTVVCFITTADGAKDRLAQEQFSDIAEAEYFVEQLKGFLPEVGSVVDWVIRLIVPGNETLIYSMDDNQSEYEHRILIRDNVDAAHYKAHMRFVTKD